MCFVYPFALIDTIIIEVHEPRHHAVAQGVNLHEKGQKELPKLYNLELPHTQDSSHHEDYEPFLGSRIPT